MDRSASVKLTDIAKRCNVSAATVSLVLSDNPRISSETKGRVLKTIQKLRYYPNIYARALSTSVTKTFCVVVPQISHIFTEHYFGEVLSGIYDSASKDGYKILLEVATYEFCFYKRYLQRFREKMIDGMFYVGSTLKDTYLADFENVNFPFLQVGSYIPGLDVGYVISDNVRGGYLATRHLFELGHRKVGFITGHFNVVSARDRYEGYKKALKEFQIPFERELIARGNFNEESGFEAMSVLLKKNRRNTRPKDRITAVFASNDIMARGAIRAVESFGLRVPRDVSVVGMDNTKPSSVGDVKLTTVDYKIYEMGSMACRKMKEFIKAKDASTRIREILPVELIVGDTTRRV